MNISDIGHFAPALATKIDAPDFNYAGEVADPLPVVHFTAEPITVEHSGSVGAVLDEIASDLDYSTYKNPHFRVVVEQYFADVPSSIDEFHWDNELYIIHEEILDQVTEF